MAASFFMPTRILAGNGCVVSNAPLLAPLGRHALIVTGGASARMCGALRDIETALSAQGILFTLFDGIEPNPCIETIRDAARTGRSCGADFVIGIGGGSPLDAAKAAAVLMTDDCDDDALFCGKYPDTTLPIVCVPTTAGTGSEVTPYAVLIDRRTRTKRSMGGTPLFPRLAFLDAAYLRTLPWDTTVNTAVDALSHALEGYLANRGTPLSEPHAILGMRAMTGVLRELARLRALGCAPAEVPSSVREASLLGSMHAGITIAQTGTTLLHSMGYCLTLARNLAHGLANGLLMPAYLDAIAQKAPDRIREVMAYLGFETREACNQFLRSLFGATERMPRQETAAYARDTVGAKNAANTPVPFSEAELADLFDKTRVPAAR